MHFPCGSRWWLDPWIRGKGGGQKKQGQRPCPMWIGPGQAANGEGEEREGVLHPHRHAQSNLFAVRPSDHTTEPPCVEAVCCLGSTGVRPLKGCKEKGGRQGQSSTTPWPPTPFWSSPRSDLCWRPSVPQGVLELVHGWKDLRNSWRIRGESQPTGSPCKTTSVGRPDGVGVAVLALKEFTQGEERT